MAAMLVAGLRVEDRLAGDGNWSPWKSRIVLILEEGELWDIVENPVVPPTDVVRAPRWGRQIHLFHTFRDSLRFEMSWV